MASNGRSNAPRVNTVGIQQLSFYRRHFEMDFLEWRCMNFDYIFTDIPDGQINGSNNGLTPTRRQAIIWTNDGQIPDAYMHCSASMSLSTVGVWLISMIYVYLQHIACTWLTTLICFKNDNIDDSLSWENMSLRSQKMNRMISRDSEVNFPAVSQWHLVPNSRGLDKSCELQHIRTMRWAMAGSNCKRKQNNLLMLLLSYRLGYLLPLCNRRVITHPWWDLRWNMLVKGTQTSKVKWTYVGIASANSILFNGYQVLNDKRYFIFNWWTVRNIVL